MRLIHVILPDCDGKLLGGDAVRFFDRSNLNRDILAKVSPPQTIEFELYVYA